MHRINHENFNKQKGFSLPDLLIVIFVISIISVLALPRIISSQRLDQFAKMQKQVAVSVGEAKQEAKSQRVPITFRYDNMNKIIITYNGNFGALGDTRNRVIDMSDFGLDKSEIIFGHPNWMPPLPLTDSFKTTETELTENSMEITFQPDGSVIDEANKPQNNALFFYYQKYSKDTAFAISILGEGGHIKVWSYSKNIKVYVEKKMSN